MKLKIRTTIRNIAIVLLSILNLVYLYYGFLNVLYSGPYYWARIDVLLLQFAIPLTAFIFLGVNVVLWLKERIKVEVVNE